MDSVPLGKTSKSLNNAHQQESFFMIFFPLTSVDSESNLKLCARGKQTEQGSARASGCN